MIEVKETLQVSAQDFFDQLLKSAAFDIRMSTGNNVNEKQIYSGYKYTKKMKTKLGRTGDVKVTITELKAPEQYAVKFESAAGKNMVVYSLESLGDNKVQVTYKEGFEGDTKSQDLNYKLISILYKRKAKKKTARKLHDIEAYILRKDGSCIRSH